VRQFVTGVVVLAVTGLAMGSLAQSSPTGSAVTPRATLTAGTVPNGPIGVSPNPTVPKLPTPTCVSVLQLGMLEVFGGTASNPQATLCTHDNFMTYTPKTSAGVEINGIVLPASVVGSLVFTPSSTSTTGGTVAIDPHAIINSVAKGSANTLTPLLQPSLTLTVPADNGSTAPQSSSPGKVLSSSDSGSIGGLAISGTLTLILTESVSTAGNRIYGTTLKLTVTLPSIFSTSTGGTGTVVLSAANENADGSPNTTGLTLAGAEIVIGTPPSSDLPTETTTGGVRLGPVQLTYLCLSYTGIAGTPNCKPDSASSTCPTTLSAFEAETDTSGFVACSQSCPGDTAAGNSWDGQLEMKLPSAGTAGLQLDGVFGTRDGKFSYAAALLSGLSIPIYPAIDLTDIGFGVCVTPNIPPTGGALQLTGLIGGTVADLIDGKILLTYQATKNPVLSGVIDGVDVPHGPFDPNPTKWYFDAKGALAVANTPVSLGGAELYIDQHVIGLTGTFGANFSASGSNWCCSGSAAAAINAAVSAKISTVNSAFNIYANVNASASGQLSIGSVFSGSASATGNGTLAASDFGFSACLNVAGSVHWSVTDPYWPNWSIDYSKNFQLSLGASDGWAPSSYTVLPAGYQHGWSLFWGSCSVEPYQDVNLVGDPTFTVPKGQLGQLVSFIGQDGPPNLTITAPNGEKLATPREAKGKPAVSPHMIMFVNAASDQTFVLLGKPPAGTYRVALEPGSTPIVEVRRADVLPKPEVSGHITAGSGRTRLLHYSIVPIPGQSVQFFEQGPVAHRGTFATIGPLQGVTERKGVIGFSSANGPREMRTIVAVVSEDGRPRTDLKIATYQAPARAVTTKGVNGS